MDFNKGYNNNKYKIKIKLRRRIKIIKIIYNYHQILKFNRILEKKEVIHPLIIVLLMQVIILNKKRILKNKLPMRRISPKFAKIKSQNINKLWN